jgi:phospholipid/cholesterol/gamma-HCH transport system ATP-binding protein
MLSQQINKINDLVSGVASDKLNEGPVIIIRDLYKSFGNNHVLSGFNIDLYKGENLVVLGKSGSGKSVLIKCIIGLLKPDKGTIEIFGNNIPELDAVNWIRFV